MTPLCGWHIVTITSRFKTLLKQVILATQIALFRSQGKMYKRTDTERSNDKLRKLAN